MRIDMNFSTKTKRFAYSLVATYAKFNTDVKAFDLDYQDVPDFDLHELAAYVMSDSPELAGEATSVDNPNYERTMQPTLYIFMLDSTNRSKEADFAKAWRDGITVYLKDTMQSLLSDALQEYNENNSVAA